MRYHDLNGLLGMGVRLPKRLVIRFHASVKVSATPLVAVMLMQLTHSRLVGVGAGRLGPAMQRPPYR